MLVEMGERPSILSRGYAREIMDEGVVVVSDGTHVLTDDVAHSGDEPLMAARMVARAAVLVSSSRYVAGRVAETKLGCTVHVLDDGFQHFDLMRDVDLLVAPDTLDDTRTLPFGRFREPLDAAAAADALLVETDALTVEETRVSSPHDRAEALRPRRRLPHVFACRWHSNFPAASLDRWPIGRRMRLPASQGPIVFMPISRRQAGG